MSLNPDASRQQLSASDPAASVWVNANAGSGKTHVLVDRVVRLMLGGTDPARIMCLTFTKAAAAEMKNRLFERLSKWIAMDDAALAALLANLGAAAPDQPLLERARQLFTRALETPGGLKIQTIHAFCERVLQLFPVEAGVVPHFTMLGERESADLLLGARDRVLLLAKTEAGSAIGAALLDVANRVGADEFDRLLRQVLSSRANLRDVLDAGTGTAAAELLLRRHLALADAVTAESTLAGLALDRDAYRRFADALDGGTGKDLERAAFLRQCCARDGASLLDLKNFYLTAKNEPRAKDIANKSVRTGNSWLDAFIDAEQTRLVDTLGRLGELDCVSASLSVLRLGSAIVAEFEAEKRRRGCYDFEDLILNTGRLLSEKPDAAWVLYKLDGGIEHLLVDEAQDTSPAQWSIVRTLTAEFFAGEGRHGRKPRTVFVVGDRKQSIYSFQGADPNVFEAVYDDFRANVRASGQEFRPVDLTVSFRSAPEILAAVDLVFGRDTPARRGLDGARPRDWHHESNRRDARGTVEIWPLVEPLERPPSEPWQAPVDRQPAHAPARRLARQLARTIKSWIGQRWLESEKRAVRPGDVLILVRSRNAFFDAMIRALWNERVPVAGADRLKLAHNIAVLDLMALAQFCMMPEDDHALACILKSPVLSRAFGEDELLAVAAERKGSLWEALRAMAKAEPAAGAVAELAPLVSGAPAARPFEFLSAVLATARRRFVARLGSEANDAIDALLDLALDYEETHGASLAGFANWFAAGESEIRRNMEQGSNEVRIMTVHGAKGLEAPIVILPDTAGFDARPDALLMLEAGNGNARVPFWVVPKLHASDTIRLLKDGQKQDHANEQRRLLYVAMTRARDELYICGHAGLRSPPDECWYNIVCNALKAHPSVVELAEPQCWRMGAPPMAAAEQEAAPPPDVLALPAWISAAAATMAETPAPTPRPRRDRQRVARGILIHRILQHLPELSAADRPAYIASTLARSGADPRLAQDLAALLDHPVLGTLFADDGLSEVPLIAPLPGQPPQRRRIDRLVVKPEGIMIADYKTDREVPASIEACSPEYIAQMAAYRDALRLLHPAVPLTVALIWTEAPILMIVPDAAMDAVAGSAFREPPLTPATPTPTFP